MPTSVNNEGVCNKVKIGCSRHALCMKLIRPNLMQAVSCEGKRQEAVWKPMWQYISKHQSSCSTRLLPRHPQQHHDHRVRISLHQPTFSSATAGSYQFNHYVAPRDTTYAQGNHLLPQSATQHTIVASSQPSAKPLSPRH